VISVRRLALSAAFTVLAALTLGAQAPRSEAAQKSTTEGLRADCGSMYPAHPRAGEPVRLSAEVSGDEATLSGTYGGSYISEISKASLMIRDHGRVVLSERLGRGSPFFKDSISLGFSFPVYKGRANPPEGPLCVVQLAPRERPSVLLDLYTGGAHCCTILDGYRFGSDRREITSVDLGNPDAQLVEEGGRFVIITADNSFAYAFSSFAGSGMPVEVLSFSGDSFTNVTRDYLGIVAENSNLWQSLYYENPSTATGLLAAWVADQDRLGESASAWAFVEGLVQHRQLTVTPWFKNGAAYLTALRALLVKDGYQAS
jgi:hypothetical protein